MKSIYKHSLLLILLSSILFGSCEKWLDETSTENIIATESYVSSVRDLERLLNGSYATLLGYQGKGLAGSPFLISSLNSDLVAPYPSYEEEISPEIMMIYNRQNSSTGEGSPAWEMIRYAYRAVNNANMVIEALENGTLEKDPDYLFYQERMRGEAYLMRAFALFEVTKLVGKQYNEGTSGSDLAGYYPTKPVYEKTDFPSERVTVARAYDMMIEDANKAISLLPVRYDLAYLQWGESFGYPSIFYIDCRRFNRDIAYAFKAKLHFQMNDFENALAACNELLGDTPGSSTKYPLSSLQNLQTAVFGAREQFPHGPYLVEVDAAGDTKPVPVAQEIICDFYGSSATYGPNRDRNSWAYYFTPAFGEDQGRSRLGEQGLGWFSMLAGFDMYLEWDWNDFRLFFFADEMEDEDWEIWYWPVKFTLNNLNVLWYRSAEFFLMRAECHARLGNRNDAIADMNLIRQRARIGNYEGSIDDSGDLPADIVRERARELFMENNRYWDLLRLGALTGDPIPAGSRDTDTPWDSPDLLFPMPDLY
jgi:starch-binding outer membrane protein, SusD/RagB family